MKRHSKGRSNRHRFVQSILDTEEVMDTYRTKFAVDVTKPIPGRLQILKGSILSEISEIVTILQLTYNCMQDLYSTQERMDKLREKMPDGTVDESTPAGALYVSVMSQHMELLSKLRIHMKTIYEWLYHLMDLVRSCRKIRSLVPNPYWKKLQSHCEFRSKLVAHKKGIQAYTSAGMRYSPKDFNAELLLTPFVPPVSALKELASLFTQCAGVLINEEANEKNYFERCRILYHNLDRFADGKRKQIVSFIKRYGTISAQPIELAEFVGDLARDLIPKLAELGN